MVGKWLKMCRNNNSLVHFVNQENGEGLFFIYANNDLIRCFNLRAYQNVWLLNLDRTKLNLVGRIFLFGLKLRSFLDVGYFLSGCV
jgi:hypothetical protein